MMADDDRFSGPVYEAYYTAYRVTHTLCSCSTPDMPEGILGYIRHRLTRAHIATPTRACTAHAEFRSW